MSSPTTAGTGDWFNDSVYVDSRDGGRSSIPSRRERDLVATWALGGFHHAFGPTIALAAAHNPRMRAGS